jgi:hypothetical protein
MPSGTRPEATTRPFVMARRLLCSCTATVALNAKSICWLDTASLTAGPAPLKKDQSIAMPPA